MINSTKKEPAATTVDSRVKEKNFTTDYNTKAIKRFNAVTNDEAVGFIYRTYNYKQFKINQVNRHISKNHVREIVKAIRNDHVILPVIQVNPKMEIIDGQHRFKALMQLGLPVYYYVDRQLTDESIIQINSKQSRWHLREFIHARAEQGVEGYAELESYIKKYRWLTATSSLLVIFSGRTKWTGGGITKEVQAGKFQFGDKNKAIEFLDKLADIKIHLTKSSQLPGRMVTCVWAYYNRPEVNKNKLLGLINDDFMLKLPRNLNGSMLFIGQQYNNKARSKIKFSTDYKGQFHFED